MIALIQALWKWGQEAARLPQMEAWHSINVAGLPHLEPQDQALMRYVIKLTLSPREMARADLKALRQAGFSDRDAHDIVNVVACFSYMNRLADGLGVVVEPHKYDWAKALLGEEALRQHLAWGRGDAHGSPLGNRTLL